MAHDEGLKRIVDRSGFPLQLGLKSEVVRTAADHRFKVIYQEHSWRAPNGDVGFLDLVLEDEIGKIELCVECKRSMDTDWIFLQPSSSVVKSRVARGWATLRDPRFLGWYDFTMAAAAPEASFCVIPKGESMPLLEKIAAELLCATEALAYEECGLRPRSIRMHFCAIVTTARLKIGVFDAGQVSLVDGTTAGLDFQDVPVVMFRKQLSAHAPGLKGGGLQPPDIAAAQERTVFVVQAAEFSRFLADLDVTEATIRELKYNHLR